jgi:hypothetical protein
MQDLLGFFDLRIIFRKIRKSFRAFAGDRVLAIDARATGGLARLMRGCARFSFMHRFSQSLAVASVWIGKGVLFCASIVANSGCRLRLIDARAQTRLAPARALFSCQYRRKCGCFGLALFAMDA